MFKSLKEKFKYMGDFYLFLATLICVWTGIILISRNIPSDSVLRLRVFRVSAGSKSSNFYTVDFLGAYGLHLIFSITFLLTVAIKLLVRFLKKPEQRTPMLEDQLHLLVFSVSVAVIILLYVLNQYIRLATNTL